MDSPNEGSPVKKRLREIEVGNEDSPVKKKRRKIEIGDEESLVKKRQKDIETGDEEIGKTESPDKKRQKEIEVRDDDSPDKKRRKKIEIGDESLVKKRQEDIETGDEEIEIGDKESPDKKRQQKEIEIKYEAKNRETGTDSEDSMEFSVEEVSVKRAERQMKSEDLIKDIHDLDEPSCMDRIIMYLEEIKDEDYFFMELLLEKLRGEKITWDQPWYQKSNSLSRPLKSDDNENNSTPYRTDTICKAECDKIQKNWNEFMKLYKVPDKLICLARWKNKDKSRLPNTPEEQARRFVVAYLARGLQRTIYQVFRHIMTYFGGSVKGAYSEDEEKIMKICFMHHPNDSVTILSKVLGREPRGIYKRLQQMFNGKPEKKKLKWTLPLATKFLRLLLKYTQIPLEELKYRKIDKEIWLKLEKKFDHHYVHLQAFWYGSLHVQVFVKEDLKINKLRKRVYKRLMSSSYQVWTDIRWKDLVKQFTDGLTHRFLYQVSQRVVRRIPEYLKKPLSEVAHNALDILKNHQYRKRRLKTLQFNENGELEVVRLNSSDLGI